ncbi:hypothetical protein Hanom_Chr00s000001g01596701 [Helianthus anomalus]
MQNTVDATMKCILNQAQQKLLVFEKFEQLSNKVMEHGEFRKNHCFHHSSTKRRHI